MKKNDEETPLHKKPGEKSTGPSTGSRKVVNPMQSAVNRRNEMREAALAKITEEANKDQKRFDRCMYFGIFCLWGAVIGVVLLVVKYFVNGYEKRDEIDISESVVHARFLDYTTGELVDCSNDHPCEGWTCEYVREHFRRNPDECKYNDWMDGILICLAILSCCACLACLAGGSGKSG